MAGMMQNLVLKSVVFSILPVGLLLFIFLFLGFANQLKYRSDRVMKRAWAVFYTWAPSTWWVFVRSVAI